MRSDRLFSPVTPTPLNKRPAAYSMNNFSVIKRGGTQQSSPPTRHKPFLCVPSINHFLNCRHIGHQMAVMPVKINHRPDIQHIRFSKMKDDSAR
jgi:hypothetical protein